MGIHRVGNGSLPPEAVPSQDGASEVRGVRDTRPTDPAPSPFEVRRDSVAPAAPAEAVKPSAALEGVRSGALDVKGYVDAKVEEATAHLSHLSPSQLSVVRGVVREQLLSNPHLAALAQQATGSALPKEDTEEGG